MVLLHRMHLYASRGYFQKGERSNTVLMQWSKMLESSGWTFCIPKVSSCRIAVIKLNEL